MKTITAMIFAALSLAPAYASGLPIPRGAWDFCQRTHDAVLCDAAGSETAAPFSSALHRQLFDTHDLALRKIRFQEDSQHYGAVDYWAMPDDGRGDCEDYAIWEAHRLVDSGLPAGALAIAVVRNDNNTEHAVLLVHTDKGDFILDSMVHGVSTAVDYRLPIVKLSSGSLLNWRAP